MNNFTCYLNNNYFILIFNQFRNQITKENQNYTLFSSGIHDIFNSYEIRAFYEINFQPKLYFVVSQNFKFAYKY